MKTLTCALLCCAVVTATAQLGTRGFGSAEAPGEGAPPVDLGANHRTWLMDPAPEPGAQDAVARGSTETPGRGRVTQLGTGMNYLSPSGWAPSVAAFSVTADETAFEASRVRYWPRVAPDLNVRGAIRLAPPGHSELKLTPTALVLYSADTGEAVVIAGITNCTAVLVSSNQLYFPDAFRAPGVCAGILLTVRADSFEQDLLISGRLDPARWGFSGDVRLQIWTETYDTETPDRERTPLRVERDPLVRGRKASPDLIDETLWFGKEFTFSAGQAYTMPSETDPDGTVAVVAKEYQILADGRSFIVESVQLADIGRALNALPECDPGPEGGALGRPPGKTYAAIPVPPAQPRTRPVANPRLLAQAVTGPRVTIDYRAQLTSQVLLDSSTTYLVASTVNATTLTVEGGACVKLKTNASIFVSGTLTCRSSQCRPAYFSGVDDDLVGESLAGFSSAASYTGVINTNGYGNPALGLAQSSTVNGCVFRYARMAVANNTASPITLTANHSQFINCIKGLSIVSVGSGSGSGTMPTTAALVANNVLMANVQNPVYFGAGSGAYTSYSFAAANCTFDRIGTCFYSASLSALGVSSYNSIYANVTNSSTATYSGAYNGFYRSAIRFGTAALGSDSVYPFQTVCLGNYYLSDAAGFRDAGTTTGVPAAILADLKLRTTYPPVVLGQAEITNALVLTSQAQRDTDALDLGFHADPLDFIASNATLSAQLTLSNGVAVGLAGNYGFKLLNGANITSVGSAVALNRLASVVNVQDQPSPAATSRCFQVETTLTGTFAFRFTDFSQPPGSSGGSLLAAASGAYVQGELSFRDCRLRGANLNLGYGSGANTALVALTNNLLERCDFRLSRQTAGSAVSFYAFNNLMRGGNFTLSYSNAAAGDPGWYVRDNLFHNATNSRTWSGNNYITSSTNGFTAGTADGLGTAGALTNLTADFQSGALGDYYYPASGTGLFKLVNAGDRTAAAASLYHYTVHTNQTKEAGTVLDVGWHLVAVDASGKPIDSDGDGIADVLEDANGNGLGTDDPTSWTNYNSANGLSSGSGLKVFTPFK